MNYVETLIENYNSRQLWFNFSLCRGTLYERTLRNLSSGPGVLVVLQFLRRPTVSVHQPQIFRIIQSDGRHPSPPPSLRASSSLSARPPKEVIHQPLSGIRRRSRQGCSHHSQEANAVVADKEGFLELWPRSNCFQKESPLSHSVSSSQPLLLINHLCCFACRACASRCCLTEA